MAVRLIRHTRPMVAEGICYGRTDLALSAEGRTEAARLAADLGPVARVFTSPLGRCRHLAGLIAPDSTVSEAWIEMDFGNWEGLPWQAVPRAELDGWADDFMHYRGHGGESVAQVRARVAAGLEALPEGAVVVTHAGVIKAALDVAGHRDAWRAKTAFGEIVTL